MKRFSLLLLFIYGNLTAQTGIGTTTPNTSAKLDVFATNKGFLPPRVTLTGVYDATTIPSPATGLLVYCTGTGGLAAGYYFWNGIAWATIATEGGSGSVVAEFGTQILGSNVAISSATPTTVLSFTLPSAGTWEIISFVRSQGTAGYAAEFGIYDSSGNLVPNSEILPAYGQMASTGTGIVRITTSGSAIYTVRAWASTGSYGVASDGNGRTGVTWQKISGNAPVYWAPSPPVGSVISFAGNAAPSGYLICDGSAVSRTNYSDLYTIIGTTYGAGNGSTTFNLPDLRSKTIVGVGQGNNLTNRTLASNGGAETKTLLVTELPPHNHTINDPGHAHTQTTVNDDFNNSPSNPPGFTTDGGGSRTWSNINSNTTGITINNTGGGTSFNIMNPFLALNYIIKF